MTGALLDDIRVVDLGGPGVAYARRMLADLGADVVMIEPPDGRAERDTLPVIPASLGGPVGARFAHNAAGARSVVVDTSRSAGCDLVRRLVLASDVVLTGADVGDVEALGLGWEALHEADPRLVYASVTPFGRTGPRRRWRGTDLTAWASSGALPSIGDPDRAPLAPRGELALTAGALNAVMGVLAALMVRDQSGLGQLVDISLQESVMSVALEFGPMVVLEGGFDQQRTGRRRPGGPIGHYPTVDGAVNIVAYMPEHWRRLAQWVQEETGVEEIAADVFAESATARSPYSDLVDSWVEGLTTRYTKQAFFEEAQRRGITVGPVNTPRDVLADTHLAATDGWTTSTGGDLTVRFPTPPLLVDGASAAVGSVPRVGADTAAVLRERLAVDDVDRRLLERDGAITP